jgi:anti-anti-sigma factor
MTDVFSTARPALSISMSVDRGPVPGSTDDGAVVRVELVGELDASTVPELGQVLTRLCAGGHRWIIVDGTGLRFLGTAGLTELMRTSAVLRRRGGGVQLTGLAPVHRRLIDRIGVTDALLWPPRICPVSRCRSHGFDEHVSRSRPRGRRPICDS